MNFNNPIFLAPMSGFTDLPFRILAQKHGADVTVSEMVSAKGIYYRDKKTRKLMDSTEEENNFGIQLFGSEPEILKSALDIVQNDETLKYDFIDFNAGCPAPKIVKNGDGSALLKNLDLLEKNVKILKKNSSKPVSVKTRIGFEEGENTILSTLKAVENAGADFITIHGRTRSQFYSGESNWDIIGEAVLNTDLPVILSGDITSPERAKEALETGVSGLMIGREAVSNPFIFDQIKEYLSKGTYKNYSKEEKIKLILEHLDLVEAYSDSKSNIINMRKHLASYTKGFENATNLRREIFRLNTVEEARNLFKSL